MELLASTAVVFSVRMLLPLSFWITRRGIKSSDGVSHLCSATLMKRQAHRPFTKMPRTSGSGEDYPWLYSWLLSFLPEKQMLQLGMMTGAVMDTLLWLVCLIPIRHLQESQMIPSGRLLSTALLFALTPHMTRITTGKVVPRPRPFACLMGNILILFLWYFLADKFLWAYICALVLYIPLSLTSRFAVQAICGLSIILGVLSKSIPTILFPTVAIALSALITHGSSWLLLKAQVRHSKIYWTLAYDFVQHKNKVYFPKSMNISEIWKAINALFFENAYVLCITGLPLLIPILLYLLETPHSVADSRHYLGLWLISGLVVLVGTSFWKFKVFGQAERYMDYCIVPYFALGSLSLQHMPSWFLASVAIYGLLFFALHFIAHYLGYGAPMRELEKIRTGFRWLNNIREASRIISIPYTLSRYGLMETQHVFLFTQGLDYGRRSEYSRIFSHYPFPPYDLTDTVAAYDINYVVVGKKMLKGQTFRPLDHKISENDYLAIYDVRNLHDRAQKIPQILHTTR